MVLGQPQLRKSRAVAPISCPSAEGGWAFRRPLRLLDGSRGSWGGQATMKTDREGDVISGRSVCPALVGWEATGARTPTSGAVHGGRVISYICHGQTRHISIGCKKALAVPVSRGMCGRAAASGLFPLEPRIASCKAQCPADICTASGGHIKLRAVSSYRCLLRSSVTKWETNHAATEPYLRPQSPYRSGETASVSGKQVMTSRFVVLP